MGGGFPSSSPGGLPAPASRPRRRARSALLGVSARVSRPPRPTPPVVPQPPARRRGRAGSPPEPCLPAGRSRDSGAPPHQARTGRGGAGLPWSRPLRPRPPGKVSCVGAAAGSAEPRAQSRAAARAADPGVSVPQPGSAEPPSSDCHPRFALPREGVPGTPARLGQCMRLKSAGPPGVGPWWGPQWRRGGGGGGGREEEEDGELTAANYWAQLCPSR